MKFSVPIFLLAVLLPAALFGQPRKPTTIAELVTYNGKDREQVLYAGAKAEGKLTWYTSLAGEASTSPDAIRSSSAGGMIVWSAISWVLSFFTNSTPLVLIIAPMTL